MYSIIQNIISHTWVTTNAGDQQYIYYIAGALIIILTVTFIDIIRTLFGKFIR